jgi:hypothetical protein
MFANPKALKFWGAICLRRSVGLGLHDIQEHNCLGLGSSRSALPNPILKLAEQ